jgi:hydrogenase maturation protease
MHLMRDPLPGPADRASDVITMTRPTVRILVCGNADRCDDGAAIWAVGHLLPGHDGRDLPGVSVIRCGQLDVDDLLAGANAPTLIVDTAVGVAPGRVVTLNFDQLVDHPRQIAPHSSHALPIDQVIGIARELADGPVDGLFVGIGAASVGYGQKLSRQVRESMGEFVVAIEMALMRLSSGPVHVS